MALIEYDLFRGKVDKVQLAINRLKTFEPPEGYYLAFSGGKDSVTIKTLADMAKVKYDAHYNVTTIDPPELVRFIRKEHSDVIFEKPKKPFFKLIIEKQFPPMRHQRWCCELLKEQGAETRVVITGVRWAESHRRKKRRLVEQCIKGKNKTYLNPIIDWTNEDVWEFIKKYKIKYCSLYDEGFKRIGCMLCPMANNKKQQTERWPKFTKAYKSAFQKIWDKYGDREHFKSWKNADEMFEWWINNHPRINPDQTVMFE